MKYLLFITLLWAACSEGGAKKENAVLAPAEFEAKLQSTPDGQVLDVRAPDEYTDGHLTNSVNYNINDPSFAANIAKMDKHKPVFVYCAAGSRSAAAAKQLQSAGFEQVYDLKGGINAWVGSGRKVVQ